MEQEKIKIGGTLCLEIYRLASCPKSIGFTYTEHSTDHWHSDSETEVDIDKETAERIVAALTKYFDIAPPV